MVSPSGGRRAIDVHAHAMPLPLLARLADRGLADLDGVPDGIVRLDPRVSGVGPWAPLPLARSQYDVGGAPVGDGRGGGGPARRVAAAVPVRLDLRRRAVRRRRRAAGQRRAGRLRGGRPGPPARAGVGAARVPRRGRRGPAVPRRAGAGRDRDRQPRRRSRPRRPGERRAVGAARRARDVRLPAPQRRARTRSGSATGTCRSSSATPPRPPSRSPAWCSAARWSGTRSTCAWRTAAAACRRCAGGWTWAGSARRSPGPRRCRRARTPTGSTTTRRCSTRRCCARLVEDVGADHVMMGTDHPFELADFTPVQTVRGAGAGRGRDPGDPLGQRGVAARAAGGRLRPGLGASGRAGQDRWARAPATGPAGRSAPRRVRGRRAAGPARCRGSAASRRRSPRRHRGGRGRASAG